MSLFLLNDFFSVCQVAVGTWLFIIGRCRPFFAQHSMNRIDMLFSINGLLILKDPISVIHLRATAIKCKLIIAMILLINNIRRKARQACFPLAVPKTIIVNGN